MTFFILKFFSDWLLWCGGKHLFLFTDFETGQLAESLIGFTKSSLESVAFLWGRYHMQKNDTFVCPIPATPYTRVTCIVSWNPKDSVAEW